ncbi:MAG TPA: phage tail sheath subtilisin-like domain-containing protein [Longimicrobiaceae bacterium]|nr:phage tail sheath subtilisin-like domain-containing protein [Longimicrobiaceae bacterium]
MPEYLAPGVYVEEVSFRSKSIEGVPTSTTGFAGMTRYGPVAFTRDGDLPGPTTSEPRLITSFTEFERVYGGLELLTLDDQSQRIPYLAHAARAYFLNGGKRLYVSRVYDAGTQVGTDGTAFLDVPISTQTATWRARWPGSFGNVWVKVVVQRSRNVAYVPDAVSGLVQAQRARHGAIVEVYPDANSVPDPSLPLDIGVMRAVSVDVNGVQTFIKSDGTALAPGAGSVIQLVEVNITVVVNGERQDFYPELAFHPDQKRYIGRILEQNDPADENSVVWLDWDKDVLGNSDNDRMRAALLLAANLAGGRLANGHDGTLIAADGWHGLQGKKADPDDVTKKATGLEALGEIDDIAIVAAPDAATLASDADVVLATGYLIAHAEELRYRIAVVDGPPESSMNQIREFRGKFDSKYAALYHPWIVTLDPLERAAQGAPPRKIYLPPSGFVCGIYARTDIERGVHKAPANEIVRGLTEFEININKARQDVLNPEGINALRFFPGRGSRVWGARTMSSDPEWKYVNVRRLFIYLEHSIDKATQWAVFEPNGDRLWNNIRRTIEDFLLVQWKNGALLGEKPEKAYFVRCDRTTMTQNDLDNGRMICLIGVSPVKPAEFVIFRIGQWTGDAVTTPTS